MASPSAGLSRTAISSDLDSYVKNYDYARLTEALDGMPASADRNYFRGLLANRAGHIAESIALLTTVLPELELAQPERAAIALHSLADDYVKTYRYIDAVGAYEELLNKFAAKMEKVEKQSAEDDYHTVLLFRSAPPQTISFAGDIDLPTHRNKVLNTIDADLTVNGVEQSWILDTGANFSTVSAGFASNLGVTISHDAAQTQGITGAENTLRVALLPEMKLGGATVHNVVLLVLDDDNLNVYAGKTRYQINAVLGYPVLQALERNTFAHDGHFLAGPGSPSGAGGARLYMDQLTPLLECEVEKRKAIFSFDTGAGESILSDRFHRDFADLFRGLKPHPYGMAGAGGMMKGTAYYLPKVELGVGQAQAVLHKVPVVPAIGAELDRRYGNLGRDLVDPYSSFTIDWENMRFLLGEKRTGSEVHHR